MLLQLGLLLLHLFETFHKAGFLLRLTFVLLNGGTHLVLVNHLAEDEHLDEGDDVDQHVVITQTRRVVVEDAEEHDGHEIHHLLHRLHLRVAGVVHLLVVHVSVDERGDGHQDGEQAEVIHTEELRELDDAVVSREVIGP